MRRRWLLIITDWITHHAQKPVINAASDRMTFFIRLDASFAGMSTRRLSIAIRNEDRRIRATFAVVAGRAAP
jgi:hypothetical protein